MTLKTSNNNIFFTSDTHFGHTNIIKYVQRPFTDANEMNERLIENWNSVCDKDSVVYHLGDFALAVSIDEIDSIVNRLNFKELHLIEGNHEKCFTNWYHKRGRFDSRPVSISPYKEFRYNDIGYVLFHFPIRNWHSAHWGSYHLFGHVHGNIPDDPTRLAIDVGVDCNNFTPVSITEIEARMKAKNFIPMDKSQRKANGGASLDKAAYAREERYRLYLALKKEFEV